MRRPVSAVIYMYRRTEWRKSPTFTMLTLLLALFATRAAAMPEAGALRTMESSVLRVHAIYPNGAISRGSAVRLDATRYATACHVLRDARAAFLISGRRYVGTSLERADFEFDLCVLEAAEETDAAIAPVRADPVTVGDTVYAVGYPRGQGMVVSSGRVYGRHGEPGREVIQTSAAFEEGASGGGLFDAHGRLLGVLSFLVPLKGPNYFALPTSAVTDLHDTRHGADITALWMLPIDEQPRFLQALSYGAQRNWDLLRVQSAQWASEVPSVAAPWMANGLAMMRLDRRAEAVSAYRHAIDVEPQRLDELQRLRDLLIDAHDSRGAERLTNILSDLSSPSPTASR